jgi:hypothetical protein
MQQLQHRGDSNLSTNINFYVKQQKEFEARGQKKVADTWLLRDRMQLFELYAPSLSSFKELLSNYSHNKQPYMTNMSCKIDMPSGRSHRKEMKDTYSNSTGTIKKNNAQFNDNLVNENQSNEHLPEKMLPKLDRNEVRHMFENQNKQASSIHDSVLSEEDSTEHSQGNKQSLKLDNTDFSNVIPIKVPPLSFDSLEAEKDEADNSKEKSNKFFAGYCTTRPSKSGSRRMVTPRNFPRFNRFGNTQSLDTGRKKSPTTPRKVKDLSNDTEALDSSYSKVLPEESFEKEKTKNMRKLNEKEIDTYFYDEHETKRKILEEYTLESENFLSNIISMDFTLDLLPINQVIKAVSTI